MKVSELGEFALIELIAKIVGKASRDDVVLGIGDDASVWRTDESIQVATTDTLIQGVHFTFNIATWRDLGWKALATNISDIAAMGAKPCYALVSLGLPPEVETDSVVELYHGLMELASEYNVDICGGNITSSPIVVINLMVIGQASGHILKRSAASPGDKIAVTGYLGQAAAGIEMMKSTLKFNSETTSFLREAHLHPCPRVGEGQILVQQGVRAAIDLSDGLVSDLTHIAKASCVEARICINKLPIHPFMRTAFHEQSLKFALSGGEDYELLFSAKSEVIDRINALSQRKITIIGDIVDGEAGQVVLYDERGQVIQPHDHGWEHFKSLS